MSQASVSNLGNSSRHLRENGTGLSWTARTQCGVGFVGNLKDRRVLTVFIQNKQSLNDGYYLFAIVLKQTLGAVTPYIPIGKPNPKVQGDKSDSNVYTD